MFSRYFNTVVKIYILVEELVARQEVMLMVKLKVMMIDKFDYKLKVK